VISLHTLANVAPIGDLKAAYLKTLVAPMDGMWDTGLVNPFPHWEINGMETGPCTTRPMKTVPCFSSSFTPTSQGVTRTL